MKKCIPLAVAIVLALSLTACSTARDNGMQTNSIRNQSWDNPRNNNMASMHNNTRMAISDQIADSVTEMPEVESSYVLLTDHNAYVAVALDNGRGYGATDFGRSVTDFNDRAAGTRGDVYANDLNARSKGAAGTTDRTGTADSVGRRGPALGGGTDGVTDELKSRIAERVKQINPNIQHVYVSASPDFVSRMQSYANRARNGQPLRGLIIEFNTVVERLFPTEGLNR